MFNLPCGYLLLYTALIPYSNKFDLILIKCGMDLLTHSQTSTVRQLKFDNGEVISIQTLLGM